MTTSYRNQVSFWQAEGEIVTLPLCYVVWPSSSKPGSLLQTRDQKHTCQPSTIKKQSVDEFFHLESRRLFQVRRINFTEKSSLKLRCYTIAVRSYLNPISPVELKRFVSCYISLFGFVCCRRVCSSVSRRSTRALIRKSEPTSTAKQLYMSWKALM